MKYLRFVLFGAIIIQSSLSFAAGQHRPIFEPEELNSIRAQATAQVLADLEAMGPEAYQEAAIAYFKPHDGHYGDGEVPASVSLEDLQNKLDSYRSEQVMLGVHKALKERYPDHITETLQWGDWNNVGTTFERIAIASCSTSEYIAFWGTNLPQTGFSGRYPHMEVWDIMMTGKMRSFGPGTAESNAITYEANDNRLSYLAKDTTRVYDLGPQTYMLDYGRGAIVTSFWQGVIRPAFGNSDWGSAWGQFKSCAKAVFGYYGATAK